MVSQRVVAKEAAKELPLLLDAKSEWELLQLRLDIAGKRVDELEEHLNALLAHRNAIFNRKGRNNG